MLGVGGGVGMGRREVDDWGGRRVSDRKDTVGGRDLLMRLSSFSVSFQALLSSGNLRNYE